ncbi:MAG: DUF4365 domain-containing protein [Gemmataceae bacterium]
MMSRRRPGPRRKTRTREHVIADLAINHVERQALLCGFTVEEFTRDYGIDLAMVTYNPDGEVENGLILIQVKATERLDPLAAGDAVTFRVDRADLAFWLPDPYPVVLAVYEAASDAALWVHVQGHFRSLPDFNLFAAGQTVTIHLPRTRVLDPAAMRHFADIKDRAFLPHPGADPS